MTHKNTGVAYAAAHVTKSSPPRKISRGVSTPFPVENSQDHLVLKEKIHRQTSRPQGAANFIFNPPFNTAGIRPPARENAGDGG